MYATHPSDELNAMFAAKPYQGVAPQLATFLFVGLDANYDTRIDRSPIFPKILEYHNDGVAFWRQHGVHYPFLLEEYAGDGRLYHRSFARIGFGPQHAHLVSFIELLHVPTVGRNKVTRDDLDPSHLKMLDSAILNGAATHVFVPAGVAQLMCATKAFQWLPRTPPSEGDSLGIRYRRESKTVYSHLHFSVYGKFEQRKAAEAAAIRDLLPVGNF